MSLPTSNANGQSSIRNFFRPQQPSYAPPPSASSAPPPPAPGIPNQSSPPAPSDVPTSSSRPPPLPPSQPSPTLHPQATISAIEPEHVPALRRITSLLLPVSYPDSFYARLSDPLSSGAFSRVLLWRDDESSSAPPKVIGGLVCRPEPSPFQPGSPTPLGATSIFQKQQPPPPSAQSANALYIQSLVLLSPYRGLGLAAALLDDATASAARSEFACQEVYAHVWTENADGLRWYLARGFRQAEEVKGYYFKLRPDSAWVVRREIAATSTSEALGLGLGLRDSGRRSSSANGSQVGRSVTAAAANLLLNTNAGAGATPPVLATSTLSPPPPRSGGSGPTTPTGLSYQNTRPGMEWNDLPADMHASRSSSNLGVPAGSSGTSSRSSSAGRKKRDRAYPAAAFGS